MYAYCARRSMPAQIADFCVARWPGGFGAGWALPRFQRVRSCPAGNRYFSLPPPGRLRKSDSLFRCIRGVYAGTFARDAGFSGLARATHQAPAGRRARKQCTRHRFAPERCRVTSAGGLGRGVALIRHDIVIALQLR